MILVALVLRALLGRRLPHVTFYALWIVVLVRMVIPGRDPLPRECVACRRECGGRPHPRRDGRDRRAGLPRARQRAGGVIYGRGARRRRQLGGTCTDAGRLARGRPVPLADRGTHVGGRRHFVRRSLRRPVRARLSPAAPRRAGKRPLRAPVGSGAPPPPARAAPHGMRGHTGRR